MNKGNLIALFLFSMAIAVPSMAVQINDDNMIPVQKNNVERNPLIFSWSPQIIENVYVNNTESQIIEYSITTGDNLTDIYWKIDDLEVEGNKSGNTSSYSHKWDDKNTGSHIIIFEGRNSESKVDFKWHVNVYEYGENDGSSVFDVINDALENALLDIKIRMFKYKLSQYNGSDNFTVENVTGLHEEFSKHKKTRETLREEFRTGNITIEDYMAALKQAQREVKYYVKFAEEMSRFALIDLKNENLSKEFENFSSIEEWQKN